MTDTERLCFFVHVMKTGGATFRRHIDHNFPAPGAVYPDAKVDADIREANILVQRLLHLPRERRAPIRVIAGHFPFVTSRLLDTQPETLTLLRDPVARTISYLKHCKRYHPHHRELPLEAIYDDPFLFPTLIRDHQVKIFSMTEHDPLESYMDVIEIDDDRSRIAEANLRSVDVVGVHERYDDFLADVRQHFGWEIRERSSWRVSEEDWTVDDAFRRRIAVDNARDVEFYEFARALVAERLDGGRAAT
jgi:hypothetical protein